MYRKQLAKETLEYTKQGFYNLDNQKIDFETNQRNSEKNSVLINPASSDKIVKSIKHLNFKPHYELTTEQTVEALFRLKNINRIGILNFASAKNPGGGFLNGANAQEESLALSSGLYLTLLENEEYYQENRNCGNMIYTDYIIYSPDVVFIRDKKLELVKNPIIASVLTAPAVNMGQVLLKTPQQKEQAEFCMKNRMRKVLAVFADRDHTNLILGAYGCGVFRNDPVKVALYWHELLEEENLGSCFENIIFAIYDKSSTQNVIKAFYNNFKI